MLSLKCLWAHDIKYPPFSGRVPLRSRGLSPGENEWPGCGPKGEKQHSRPREWRSSWAAVGRHQLMVLPVSKEGASPCKVIDGMKAPAPEESLCFSFSLADIGKFALFPFLLQQPGSSGLIL